MNVPLSGTISLLLGSMMCSSASEMKITLSRILSINRGIYTLIDDVKTGDSKSSEVIMEGMKEWGMVVVFITKEFLVCSWWLEKLVKIFQLHHQTNERTVTVLPLLYGVEKSDVENQMLSPSGEIKMVDNMTHALWKVVALALQVSRDRDEAIIIDHISREIQGRLISTLSSYYEATTDRAAGSDTVVGKGSQSSLELDSSLAVGFADHMTEMDSLLCTNLDDVRVVRVGGISGIGKTTLARIMYAGLYDQFEGSFFLADINDRFNKDGEVFLQVDLLCNLIRERNFNICSTEEGIHMIRQRVGLKKVLIVLDNVNDLYELESLAMTCNMFGSGSRIIITRDKQLLNVRGGVKFTYELRELNKGQARQLFCQHAFKQNYPVEDYWFLTKDLVPYCRGLPFVLKLLFWPERR